MTSLRAERSALLHTAIALTSLAISSSLAFLVYSSLRTVRPTPDSDNETMAGYSIAFVDSKGRRISEQGGTVKLRFDPYRIYTNAPMQKTVNVSIDQYGFRPTGPVRGLPKLVVLGGSAAFGQGVDQDRQAFPAVLHEIQSRYDVINAGVIGYLSGQELAHMAHDFSHTSAKYYVVFDGWNDLYDALIWSRGSEEYGFNGNFYDVEKRLRSLFVYETTGKYEKPQERTIDFELTEQEFEKLVSTYLSNIERMHEIAAGRGAEFLLVIQPELGLKGHIHEKERTLLEDWERQWRYKSKRFSVKYRELAKRTAEFCESRGIPFLDTNRAEPFVNSSEVLFNDPVHFNIATHRAVAEMIRTRLSG